mmetsp:Transcript_114069/g.329526  ORF Transcript_114069/g.329526 Transcript_114069/m.329526 type:complete len:564 (-) Transcript_114069:38-1729(-)
MSAWPWSKPGWSSSRSMSASESDDGMEGNTVGERLLNAMSEGYFEVLVPSVREIDTSGTETLHEGMRLMELSRQLWPEQDLETKTKCRTLRWLADHSKRDFLVRQGQSGFLIRADFVRALVEPTRVLFIGPWTAMFDEFIPEFLRMLHEGVDFDEFAVWVVECVICATVTMHTMRLNVMRPVIENILGSANLDGSETAISRLYPLKVAVSKFIDQVRPLERCLRGLLMSSDIAMANGRRAPELHHGDGEGEQDREAFPLRSPIHRSPMTPKYSSLMMPFHRQISLAGSIISDRALDGGLEEFLETSTTNTQEILDSALQISFNISEAMKYCEASLTLLRTWLLKSELAAVVIGLALNYAGSVYSLFGMNIVNPFTEGSPIWFWRIAAFVIVSSIAVVALSYRLFRSSKAMYSRRRAQFGDNVFFQRLHEDEYVLSFKASSADGALSNAALNRVLSDLRTPTDAVKGGMYHQNSNKVRKTSQKGVVKISLAPSFDMGSRGDGDVEMEGSECRSRSRRGSRSMIPTVDVDVSACHGRLTPPRIMISTEDSSNSPSIDDSRRQPLL